MAACRAAAARHGGGYPSARMASPASAPKRCSTSRVISRGTGEISGRNAETADTAATSGITSGVENTNPVTSTRARRPWSKRGRGGVEAVTGRGRTGRAN